MISKERVQTARAIARKGMAFVSDAGTQSGGSTPRDRDEDRSLVDLTIDAEEMLRIRDELRGDLVRQYYMLGMLARLQQKQGRAGDSRRTLQQARETAIMIWCLDNPMEALTPWQPPVSPPSGEPG
jgi:hypothetical protein